MRNKIKFIRAGQGCLALLGAVLLSNSSCDSFTETELPPTQLYAAAVFEDRNTATAALTDIYARIRESGLLSGKATGVGYRMGLYADELDWGGTTATPTAFFSNSVLPVTPGLDVMWNNAYSNIYAANAVIQGVAASTGLQQADKRQLTGEALVIRALEHLYLNLLYGEIPYITTTDYRSNSTAVRISQQHVYSHLIDDLQQAAGLLSPQYTDGERIRPNEFTARALLARVYLYAGQWAEAANQASAVLNQSALYSLEDDLSQVFLKESLTTIWQLKPRAEGLNAEEGAAFVFTSGPPLASLSTGLMAAFEPGDLRREYWVKAVAGEAGTWYHANKYRERLNTGSSLEYSKLLRLSEQYLIRAEARARQGELIAALEDLNAIRHAAGLQDCPAVTQEGILLAILQERRVELFTEHAHRFIDLKRFGLLDAALGPVKPGWDTTDRLLPIAEAELNLNPNLMPQNPGY